MSADPQSQPQSQSSRSHKREIPDSEDEEDLNSAEGSDVKRARLSNDDRNGYHTPNGVETTGREHPELAFEHQVRRTQADAEDHHGPVPIGISNEKDNGCIGSSEVSHDVDQESKNILVDKRVHFVVSASTGSGDHESRGTEWETVPDPQGATADHPRAALTEASTPHPFHYEHSEASSSQSQPQAHPAAATPGTAQQASPGRSLHQTEPVTASPPATTQPYPPPTTPDLSLKPQQPSNTTGGSGTTSAPAEPHNSSSSRTANPTYTTHLKAAATESQRRKSTIIKPFRSPLKQPTNPSNPKSETKPTSTTPLRHSSTSHNVGHNSTVKSRTAEKAIREEISTLQQALKILRSPRDAELQRLIGKWREVSRNAAEEVYGVSRDRVCRMGGVGGWKEKERIKGGGGGFGGNSEGGTGSWGFDQAPSNNDDDSDSDSEGSEDTDASSHGHDEDHPNHQRVQIRKSHRTRKRAERREQKISKAEAKRAAREEREDEIRQEQARQVREREREQQTNGQDGRKAGATVAEKVEDDDDDDDGAFTMGMMLRTMNIEMEVIGFDEREGRWVD